MNTPTNILNPVSIALPQLEPLHDIRENELERSSSFRDCLEKAAENINIKYRTAPACYRQHNPFGSPSEDPIQPGLDKYSVPLRRYIRQASEPLKPRNVSQNTTSSKGTVKSISSHTIHPFVVPSLRNGKARDVPQVPNHRIDAILEQSIELRTPVEPTHWIGSVPVTVINPTEVHGQYYHSRAEVNPIWIKSSQNQGSESQSSMYSDDQEDNGDDHQHSYASESAAPKQDKTIIIPLVVPGWKTDGENDTASTASIRDMEYEDGSPSLASKGSISTVPPPPQLWKGKAQDDSRQLYRSLSKISTDAPYGVPGQNAQVNMADDIRTSMQKHPHVRWPGVKRADISSRSSEGELESIQSFVI